MVWKLLIGALKKQVTGKTASAAGGMIAPGLGLGAGQAIGSRVVGAATAPFTGGSGPNGVSNGTIWMLYIAMFTVHIFDILIGFSASPAHTWGQFGMLVLVCVTLLGPNEKIGTIIVGMLFAVYSYVVVGFLADIWTFDIFSYNFSHILNGSFAQQFTMWALGGFFIYFILHKIMKQRINSGVLITFLIAILIIPLISHWQIYTDLVSGPYSGALDTIMNMFLYLFPVWFWYFGNHPRIHPPKLIRWIQTGLLILIMIILIAQNIGLIVNGGYAAAAASGIDNPAETFKSMWTVSKDSLITFGDYITGQWAAQQKAIAQEIATAQGKDFESEVEKGAVRTVGLQMGIIEPSQRTIYADQDAVFFTLIEAKSFDTQIQASASCNWTEPRANTHREAIMSPNEFYVADYQNSRLSCTIPKGQLPWTGGSGYKLQMNASFSYAASAYLERYYAKSGLMRQFGDPVRPPEDLFFQFYDLGSPPKESVRTAGPVDLALTTSNVITEFEESGKQKEFLLRVGLESKSQRWNGHLKKVHWMVISIPKEFEVVLRADSDGNQVYDCQTGILGGNVTVIEPGFCGVFDTGTYDQTELDCDEFQHLLVTPAYDHAERLDKDIIISCKVRAVDTQTILGSSPFGVRNFRARASYVYGLEQSHFFKVEKRIDETYTQNNPALYDSTVCEQEVLQNVEPNELLSLNHTKYALINQDVQRMLDDDSAKPVLSVEERQAWASASCLEQAAARSLMIQHWAQIEAGSQTGFFTIGNTYFGPLRMTLDQFDSLIDWELNDSGDARTGLIDSEFITMVGEKRKLRAESATNNTLTQTPATNSLSDTTTLSSNINSARTQLANYDALYEYKSATPEGLTELDGLLQSVKSTLTSAQQNAVLVAQGNSFAYDTTQDTNQLSAITAGGDLTTNRQNAFGVLQSLQGVLTQAGGSTQTTTSTSGGNISAVDNTEEPTDAEKKAELELRPLFYALGHLKQIIADCEANQPGLNGELDLACVLGKYQCGRGYVHDNLNSCTSYGLCQYCQSTLVPNTYTFMREAAALKNADTRIGVDGNIDDMSAGGIIG